MFAGQNITMDLHQFAIEKQLLGVKAKTDFKVIVEDKKYNETTAHLKCI